MNFGHGGFRAQIAAPQMLKRRDDGPSSRLRGRIVIDAGDGAYEGQPAAGPRAEGRDLAISATKFCIPPHARKEGATAVLTICEIYHKRSVCGISCTSSAVLPLRLDPRRAGQEGGEVATMGCLPDSIWPVFGFYYHGNKSRFPPEKPHRAQVPILLGAGPIATAATSGRGSRRSLC